MKYQKSEKSIDDIIQHALIEFSNYGYEHSSISRVCEKAHLSKGKVYHHFKSKDEIFLACVDKVFRDFIQALEACHFSSDIEIALNEYFEIRNDFFHQFPFHSKIFFIATVTPPTALIDEINLRKKEFDQFNLNFIRSHLINVELSEYFIIDEAIEAFSSFQDYFNHISNTHLSLPMPESNESEIKKRIHFFLHGILKS